LEVNFPNNALSFGIYFLLFRSARSAKKNIKPFLHSKSKRCENLLFSLEINGSIERDQGKIADRFASYFSSVASDIGDTRVLGMSKDHLYHHESVNMIHQNRTCRSADDDGTQFKFHAFSPKEIAFAFSYLDPHKNTGHDQIPSRILKIASKELFHPLADLQQLH